MAKSEKKGKTNVVHSLTNLLKGIFLGANLVSLLLLWLCCLSTMISPDLHPRIATAGLFFPFILFFNVCFVFFWLIFNVRFTLLPLLGILVVGGYVMDYCPISFHFQESADSTQLKVISWNVHGFFNLPEGNRAKSIDYLANSGADIVCLQEAMSLPPELTASMDSAGLTYVKNVYTLAVYSRYPLISCKEIPIETESMNTVILCQAQVGQDTVNIMNVHLECNRFTEGEKEDYKDMIRNPGKDRMKDGTRLLIDKLAVHSRVRGPQADIVTQQLDSLKGTPIILCGDFNDTPISYTYQTIARRLKNAYREAGNGIGISYNQRAFMVRIDHIFHSSEWRASSAVVDDNITTSDHNPVVVTLEKR